MVFIVLLRYPKIIAGKEGEQIDKDLVYALKDVLLSISSGLSMFTALNFVAGGSYGYVSKDIKRVVNRVNTGVPLEDALEELAISTPSEHFQSALWQIINTSKSGADVEGVLRSLIANLVAEQKSDIQKYSHELNVLTLIYMLAAVTIPTIITTLMIILNAFTAAGINEFTLIILISLSFFIQIAIVGFVKSRRPVVHV
jgi:pilus assembly protein TadC